MDVAHITVFHFLALPLVLPAAWWVITQPVGLRRWIRGRLDG